ncbi:MAG: hypothetical protein Q8R14_02735 [Candidatus Omnitrophota bacterium]|nr:hypothetical protein [Candidatus Omnitrophota bacterium]
MRLRRYLLVILIVGVVFFIAYLNFDRIAVFAVSKLYSQGVSYKHMSRDPKAGLVFEDLKVVNNKLGVGFFSQRATIKPSWGTGWLKSVLLDFKFKNVRFLKNKTGENKTAYDTLSQLISMPFEGRWMYKEVVGLVEIFSNGITIKKFSGGGREMRLIVTGDLFYNNIADVDITMYFSKDVLKEIPQELHSVIMQDEPDDWKSFEVKMKGNLSSPSVQLSGKLFRLNIGTLVAND